MAAIWNLIKNIGKPVSNVINNIIQSLDDTGSGREEIARRYNIGIRRYNYDVKPLAMKADTRTLPLDDMTQEEQNQVSAIYAIERVMEFNLLQNEIPLLGFDEYEFDYSQSYDLTVPSGLSVVQTHFCSPIMNLGAKFLKIATEFQAFKVVKIQLDVSFQNQNYSTQTIAYDTLITKGNQKEMQTDLFNFMSGIAPYATGHRVVYFQSTNDGIIPNLPDGTPVQSLSAYMNILSRIKNLPTAKDYGQLVAGNLVIDNPSYVMVGMRPDVVSSPAIEAGTKYFQTNYALDFFKKFSTDNNNINMEQMPVFGKFHYAVSNSYTEPIRLITNLKYRFSCKRHIDNSTYTQILHNDEVVGMKETPLGKVFNMVGLS